MESFLTEKQLDAITGMSRTTRWRLRKDGRFPRPYSISKNRIAYLKSDIQRWIESVVGTITDNKPAGGSGVLRKREGNKDA